MLISRRMNNKPSERVVYSLDKLKIIDCVASQGWREWHRKLLEVLEVFSQVDPGDVIDNVKQRHARTSIAGCLNIRQ